MVVSQSPFKVLEINVSSAQDLPPVSKMLRTFTVAWIHPDQKLSTRIDHQGQTNPAWNYKLVFRVDDKFLRNEMACVTFEIYNVAWLRDLPIGTAYLFINHIAPPLVQNSPAMRPVSLYIRRPSGHLQGILHVGVSLIDNNVSQSPLRSELSASAFENQDSLAKDKNNDDDDDRSLGKQHSTKYVEEEIEKPDEKESSVLQKQPSVNGYGEILRKENAKESKTELKSMLKTKSFASTNLSSVTIMHPLPSEVASSLRKGFYAADGDEYGSSIFENWSEPSDRKSIGLRSKNGTWRMEGQTPSTLDGDILMTMDEKTPLKNEKTPLVTIVQEGHKPAPLKRRKNSGGTERGGGLFSCFGKGFEFTFAYGSKTAKNTIIPKIPRREKLHVTNPDARMHRFHI